MYMYFWYIAICSPLERPFKGLQNEIFNYEIGQFSLKLRALKGTSPKIAVQENTIRCTHLPSMGSNLFRKSSSMGLSMSSLGCWKPISPGVGLKVRSAYSKGVWLTVGVVNGGGGVHERENRIKNVRNIDWHSCCIHRVGVWWVWFTLKLLLHVQTK